MMSASAEIVGYVLMVLVALVIVGEIVNWIIELFWWVMDKLML